MVVGLKRFELLIEKLRHSLYEALSASCMLSLSLAEPGVRASFIPADP